MTTAVRPWCVVASVCASVCACGSAATSTVTSQLPPTVIVGTPTVVAAGSLTVTVLGQPDRTFIIAGGRWRVCDHGRVTNAASAVARDVRITVTYLDHGVVVGQTTRDDATQNGGALGDIPAAESRDFTVCGIAHNEPDTDRLTASPA